MSLMSLICTHIGSSSWLAHLRDRAAIWQVWLLSLGWWLLVFPGFLLILHQLVLFSWLPEVGFLHSWSLSHGVLIGDSILSIALACLTSLLVMDYRQGYSLLRPWMKTERVQTAIVSASGGAVYWFLLIKHQRPPNEYVIHQYAWVFDFYHWFIGTIVSSALAFGLLAGVTALLRLQRSYRLLYLVLPVLIGLYFQVIAADKPAYRMETPIRIGSSYLQPLTNALFLYPEASETGSDEDGS